VLAFVRVNLLIEHFEMSVYYYYYWKNRAVKKPEVVAIVVD